LRNFESNETVMLHVLIFIGLAINLVAMTATTRKPDGRTEEVITRGGLRDALNNALREDKIKPSPVQQFAFNIKRGKYRQCRLIDDRLVVD
jgi:hypothetical protein